MTNLEPGRRESPRRPKVTIAIPTFNRATWVKGGVLAAYQNYEIGISDNASSDETQAVLAEFDDHRLRVIRHDCNLGLTGNWNASLAFWVVGPTKSRHIPPKGYRLTLTLFISETRTVLIGSSWWRVSPPPTLKNGHRQWPTGIEARLPALSPESPVSLGPSFISFCHRRKARWPMSEKHLDGEELGASGLARSQAASCKSRDLAARRVGEHVGLDRSRTYSPDKGSSCRRALSSGVKKLAGHVSRTARVCSFG